MVLIADLSAMMTARWVLAQDAMFVKAQTTREKPFLNLKNIDFDSSLDFVPFIEPFILSSFLSSLAVQIFTIRSEFVKHTLFLSPCSSSSYATSDQTIDQLVLEMNSLSPVSIHETSTNGIPDAGAGSSIIDGDRDSRDGSGDPCAGVWNAPKFGKMITHRLRAVQDGKMDGDVNVTVAILYRVLQDERKVAERTIASLQVKYDHQQFDEH